jgi:hypothetical protein
MYLCRCSADSQHLSAPLHTAVCLQLPDTQPSFCSSYTTVIATISSDICANIFGVDAANCAVISSNVYAEWTRRLYCRFFCNKETFFEICSSVCVFLISEKVEQRLTAFEICYVTFCSISALHGFPSLFITLYCIFLNKTNILWHTRTPPFFPAVYDRPLPQHCQSPSYSRRARSSHCVPGPVYIGPVSI